MGRLSVLRCSAPTLGATCRTHIQTVSEFYFRVVPPARFLLSLSERCRTSGLTSLIGSRSRTSLPPSQYVHAGVLSRSRDAPKTSCSDKQLTQTSVLASQCETSTANFLMEQRRKQREREQFVRGSKGHRLCDQPKSVEFLQSCRVTTRVVSSDATRASCSSRQRS